MSPTMIGLVSQAPTAASTGTRKCGNKTEIYSRVTGYITNTALWNTGKREEFRQRRMYNVANIIEDTDRYEALAADAAAKSKA